MRKGTRLRDRLTGSEWTIEKVWGGVASLVWHVLVSDKGARRRATTSELEDRYQEIKEGKR